jgi:hypothetical protein
MIQSDLYFLRNRPSSNIQFTDIDGHGAPFCDASFLANAIVRVLTLIYLKAKQLEIELRDVYGDEALQISAVKK